MKLFLTITLFTLTTLAYSHPPMIGGEVVPEGYAPGVLTIFTTDDEGEIAGTCTAGKFGSKYILTAAHCVYKKNVETIGWTNASSVDLGDENVTLYGLYIKRVSIHPSYELLSVLNLEIKSNDIAIIEVDITKGNFINKFLEIPSLELDFSPVSSGVPLVTYGYGCESIDDVENQLLRKKVTNILSLPSSWLSTPSPSILPEINRIASGLYKNQIVSATLATGGTSSLCVGDSGGPVLRDGKIVAVNSSYVIDQTSKAEEAYLNLHSRISIVKTWIESVYEKDK